MQPTNKERNMKSALMSAMRLNGDSHADESMVTWEDNEMMQKLMDKTLAEHSVVRQGLYEPKHFHETDFRARRTWNTQTAAPGTAWESDLHIPEQLLKHDADKIIYTNRSCETDTHKAGAAVYTCRCKVPEVPCLDRFLQEKSVQASPGQSTHQQG